MRFLAKVCGLTRAEDAALAAEGGADFLGFVCHPPSPRHCSDLDLARPHLDRAVLVMVADTADAVLAAAARHGFRSVQPYLPEAVRAEGVQRLRAAGLRILLPWADAPDQPAVAADLHLWEPSARQTGVMGGSGQGHAMGFPPPGDFLLAGGLDAANLAGRLASLPGDLRARCRGVDAASRLEAAPGLKDPRKVLDFIRAARALEMP